MTTTFYYKGYQGTYLRDAEAILYHGELSGICDVVTFEGETLAAVRQAFRDSVDDYLEFLAATREERPT